MTYARHLAALALEAVFVMGAAVLVVAMTAGWLRPTLAIAVLVGLVLLVEWSARLACSRITRVAVRTAEQWHSLYEDRCADDDAADRAARRAARRDQQLATFLGGESA